MATNFFKRSGPIGNISMRDEFNALLLGDDTGVEEGATFLIRQTRIDDSGKIVQCTECRNPVTNEIELDYPCGTCDNSGYLFDEVPVYGWKFDKLQAVFKDQSTPVGTVAEPTYIFYLRYFEIVGKVDSLWEVAHTREGEIIEPIRRISKFNIIDVNPIRLDSSRIEFISVLTRVDDGVGSNLQRPMVDL